jgi:HrpA-like RNA helicase
MRMNLDHTVLRLKQFKIQNINSFEFLEKPPADLIDDAITNLKLLEAISADNEEITIVGLMMVEMPTEPRISKSIIESLFLNVYD